MLLKLVSASVLVTNARSSNLCRSTHELGSKKFAECVISVRCGEDGAKNDATSGPGSVDMVVGSVA